MLTTTIDSPQHKRVLRMKNNRKYDSPSYDIHKTYESNKDLIKIKKIREIHLELIKCARNINDAYGLHILMSTSIAFVLTTTIAYNLYNQIVTGAYRTHTTQIIIYFYWMTYFGLKIIIISHVCESTVKEIRDFTSQLLQNPLSFTSCGLFYLNHTLIRNVISTVTTYLIILIQVGNVPPQALIQDVELSNEYSKL
ncbi:hypothetical protein M0804_011308 [Polistes exclamans]|nr:hypothetical protein M0804_011308 [Polistes exclamans]